jgi:hypothetical protein
MRTSTNIAALAAALAAAHGEIGVIAKDRANPFFKSRYATLDAIMQAIRPILAKHKLSLAQGVDDTLPDPMGDTQMIRVWTRLIHESGEWIENIVHVPLTPMRKEGGGEMRMNAQAAGSAITYGRRYGVGALLGLATEEDDDGNAISQTPERAARREAAPRAGRAHQSEPKAAAVPKADKPVLMPAGPHKDKPLAEVPTAEIESALETALTKKLPRWIKAFEAELSRRADATADGEVSGA